MKRLDKTRTQLKKLKDSKNFYGKVFFKILYFCWATFKFIINPRYRSEQISRIRYSKQIIQVSTFTKENRYPVLFNQIAEELKNIENPKILSFGCSTGEEIFSLKQLIPKAEIIGVDINFWCIKNALRKNTYKDCDFLHASDPNWRKNEFYDCILALAVLQKTINREDGKTRTVDSFNFNNFKTAVTLLSSFLKETGLFVLDNCDYRFTDHNLYSLKYKPGGDIPVKRVRPSFDTTQEKISNHTTSHRIFRKTELLNT